MKTSHRHRLIVVAMLLPLASVALAQEGEPAGEPTKLVTDYAPVKAGTATLSLEEAIRLAVDNDPAIFLAREDSFAKLGAARANTGTFDTSLTMKTDFEHGMGLLIGAKRRGEISKRNLFRILSNRFDEVAADLEQQLAELSDDDPVQAYAECPEGVDIVIGQQSICISPRVQRNLEFDRNLLDIVIGALADTADITRLVEIRDLLDQRREDEINNIIDILRLNAFLLRGTLRDMGTAPEIEEETSLSIDLRLSKPFRSGVVFGPGVIFEYLRDNFDGKPKNPKYGGKGVPDKYTSVLGLTLDVPLGKGGGRVSAAAPERSAQINHEASLLTQTHTMSQSVFRTLFAYWQLVGTQERLALLEASARTQENLEEIGTALVEADEVAPADLAHIKARVADARAAVVDGRLAVLDARLGLAKVVGLEVEAIDDAPLASDIFPVVPDPAMFDAWRTQTLGQLAIGNRRDLESARKLQESARVLATAAKSDLRRKTDLSLTVGYTALHEGGSFRRGLEGAFLGEWVGPSAIVKLTIDWPFKNNKALGRLAQARSTEHRSQITARNIERLISANTETLIGSLRDSVKEIARLESTAEYYTKTIEFEIEKFKLGEGTAIDVILTEEQQTSTRLSLVAARQNFASLLAQLRFELGVLLSTHRSNGRVIIDEVSPLGYEFAELPST